MENKCFQYFVQLKDFFLHWPKILVNDKKKSDTFTKMTKKLYTIFFLNKPQSYSKNPDDQGHTQKFLNGGLNFSKTNQYPIVVN